MEEGSCGAEELKIQQLYFKVSREEFVNPQLSNLSEIWHLIQEPNSELLIGHCPVNPGLDPRN